MSKRSILALLTAMLAMCAWAGIVPAQATSAPSAPPAFDPATLESQFEKTMSGAVLVGRFTDSARPGAAPREERYTIQRVSKVAGSDDRWLFICRIQFAGKDVAVPLTIPVRWAGDTAVISVTDMAIPGLGTYNARVLIDGDHYAGTWRGATHGGHLWGRIERASATRPTTTQPAPQPMP